MHGQRLICQLSTFVLYIFVLSLVPSVCSLKYLDKGSFCGLVITVGKSLVLTDNEIQGFHEQLINDRL
jgi:hypothetical protein